MPIVRKNNSYPHIADCNYFTVDKLNLDGKIMEKMEGNEAEIEDRFYRQLEFGTGGLRGVIGAGTNRMNIYTVRQATQGLANYILSQGGQEKGVAIAHDSRIMSPEFAKEAALCLNANGIKTYLFESLRPTPELSFAVRELGCIAGIVITASHNPREYNGYNVALIEVLTGFKYIGEQIKLFEENHSHHYVFGLEESYGCLAGTYARDKDACVAVMMLCEVAAYYKKEGKTLWDAMLSMYEKYGYYKEGLSTLTLKGIDGANQIKQMMEEQRKNPSTELGEFKVIGVRDYLKNDTGLPISNVLYYELEDNAWCCIRPSGTEPKIKFYFGVKGSSLIDAKEKLDKLEEDLTK